MRVAFSFTNHMYNTCCSWIYVRTSTGVLLIFRFSGMPVRGRGFAGSEVVKPQPIVCYDEPFPSLKGNRKSFLPATYEWTNSLRRQDCFCARQLAGASGSAQHDRKFHAHFTRNGKEFPRGTLDLRKGT